MKRSYVFLASIVLLAALAGALWPYVVRDESDASALQFLLWFPSAMLLFSWCKADAAERAIAEPPAAALLVGILGPIGAVYYFFRSRRFARALLSVVLMIAFYLLVTATLDGAARLSATFA